MNLKLLVFISFSITLSLFAQVAESNISHDSFDTSAVNIVVLGSSTAAGVGPSSPDSSWVNRFRNFVFTKNTNFRVINLAVGGYSTYNIMPGNFINPPNRPATKPNHNLTKALEYNPKAIIINLPSNDASSGYSVNEQLNNYWIIFSVTDSLGIPVWVTTPQPRNFSDEKIKLQFEMLDSTYSVYKDMTIDFWTNFADSNGRINPAFNSGDGIHMNDKAHQLLMERVIDKNITPNYFHARADFSDSAMQCIKIDFSVYRKDFYSIKFFNNLNEEIETILSEDLPSGDYSLTYYPKNLPGKKFTLKLINKDSVINKQKIIVN